MRPWAPVWTPLTLDLPHGERAEMVIALYHNEDERLETCELARLSQLVLKTAEDFRLLIETQHIPADDPRAELYDEFADRAELLALGAAGSRPEVDDPPFTLDDFEAALPMRSVSSSGVDPRTARGPQ